MEGGREERRNLERRGGREGGRADGTGCDDTWLSKNSFWVYFMHFVSIWFLVEGRSSSSSSRSKGRRWKEGGREGGRKEDERREGRREG